MSVFAALVYRGRSSSAPDAFPGPRGGQSGTRGRSLLMSEDEDEDEDVFAGLSMSVSLFLLFVTALVRFHIPPSSVSSPVGGA